CVPDAMSLAKSLGGGLPLSAVLAGPRAASALGLGEHGSTLGGNPVACAAGLAQLKALRGPGLLKNVRSVGALLRDGLEALRVKRPDLVLEVRGRGLMLGIRLSIPAKPMVLDCIKRGLIVNSTADTVIRLLPPLSLSPAEARQGLAALSDVILGTAPRAVPLPQVPTRAPRKSL
ncbi:MAG: aminotransferase class III-fold pyridoxal phosphate-dependent enzyme, partial [bacterium]